MTEITSKEEVAKRAPHHERELRVSLFDQATKRQQKRQAKCVTAPTEDRGWRRADLYGRKF
jgi:hypothetical protein